MSPTGSLSFQPVGCSTGSAGPVSGSGFDPCSWLVIIHLLLLVVLAIPGISGKGETVRTEHESSFSNRRPLPGCAPSRCVLRLTAIDQIGQLPRSPPPPPRDAGDLLKVAGAGSAGAAATSLAVPRSRAKCFPSGCRFAFDVRKGIVSFAGQFGQALTVATWARQASSTSAWSDVARRDAMSAMSAWMSAAKRMPSVLTRPVSLPGWTLTYLLGAAATGVDLPAGRSLG